MALHYIALHYIILHYINIIYIHTLQYMSALVKKTQVIVGLSLAETGMELLFEAPCSGCWDIQRGISVSTGITHDKTNNFMLIPDES